MRICFVCLGNICRSPAAEAILIHLLEGEYADRGLDDLEVASSGTADYHVGERPHPQSLSEAQRRGIRIEHRGRQFEAEDFAHYDLVVALDGSNEADLLALAPDTDAAGRVVRLGAFASDVDEVGVQDVADPWGHPDSAYAAMYDHLTELVSGLLDAVVAGTVEQVRARVSASR